MRNGTPQIGSLKRTLATLEAILEAGGQRSLAQIAEALGTPYATVHRQVVTLVAEGFLARRGAGHYAAGPRLLRLMLHIEDQRGDAKQLLANAASEPLARLAAQTRSIVQLGTFENDMVTYRLKTGQGASALFTKVGMQLEAYCSAIGKVLLAWLPDAQREAYLATGPFVALTPRTITDPALLRAELAAVRARGHARDDEEIAAGISCLAVPVRQADGAVTVAISLSRSGAAARRGDDARLLEMLRETAAEIEAMVG